MWSDDQWAAFVSMLRHGFAARDEFTDQAASVYRLFLDGVEPEAAMNALRELVLAGQAMRPRPGEIAARVRADHGIPTFDEAMQLIYGPGGALRARPPERTWCDEATRRRRYDQAAMSLAVLRMHPLIGTFLARQDLHRLRSLPINDAPMSDRDQRAVFARKDLREAWDRHVQTTDHRQVAALAAGGGHHQLRQMDPLAALGMTPTRAALPAGDA